jgi:hypothetical protein
VQDACGGGGSLNALGPKEPPPARGATLPAKIPTASKMASGGSGGLIPPVLNPSSLYAEEARRDATRIRIYNSVLQQIYNKIRAIARIPGNERSLVYIVPEFIPGTPRFDIGDAILYIVWNLRNVGYSVSYTHPNLLFISWKAHDERYRRTDSPWSQVLHATRSQVLATPAPSVVSPVVRPQAATSGPADIVKRKTPIKKTVEFHPTPDIIPITASGSSPAVASAMYASAAASTPAVAAPPKLPGQLSARHVSFV